MSWSAPKPDEARWKVSDLYQFLRDIWYRGKMFNTFTWDPPSIPSGSTVDTTLTSATVPVLKGTRRGMSIYVTPPPSLEAGIIIGATWVAVDDTLTIRLANLDFEDAIDPAEGTWAFAGVIQ